MPEGSKVPSLSAGITLAASDEIPAIRTLADSIWNAVYPAIISRPQIDYMLGWMYAPDQIRKEIQEDHIRYFLLHFEEQAVGFAAYGPETEPEAAKLHKIYLQPELHGRGLGSYLLQHVETDALGQNFKTMALQVNRLNTRAIRSYLRNGYTKEKEAVFDIGRGFVMDDFIMIKRLA